MKQRLFYSLIAVTILAGCSRPESSESSGQKSQLEDSAHGVSESNSSADFVVLDENGELKIGHFEFMRPSILD